MKAKHPAEAYNPAQHSRRFPCFFCDETEIADWISASLKASRAHQWPMRALNRRILEKFGVRKSDNALERHLRAHEPEWSVDAEARG